MYSHLIEITLVFCLFLAFAGDILQSITRVSASVLRLPDLATHLATLSMLINRFGAAVALLLIGYSIDTEISPSKLIESYLITVLIVGMFYALAAMRGNWIMAATEKFIRFYYKVEPNVEQRCVSEHFSFKGRIDLLVIYILTITGFLLPSVAAAIFPAYRGTLLQTGFLLNSVATLYTALKIEKEIALSLVAHDDDHKWQALVLFLMSRAYACVATGAGFAIALWFVR